MKEWYIGVDEAMLKLIRKILVLCEHAYALIERRDMYDPIYRAFPTHQKWILVGKHCHKIKVKNV